MNFLLYGSGDFAATVSELIRHCGHELTGYVDDFHTGEDILGKLVDVVRSHPAETHMMAMAIGYNDLPARWRAWERARQAGYRFPALTHPRAYVADSASVAEGTLVMAGALVDVRARIGEATVLWPGTCVSHDTQVEANCFLSPGAILCGDVRVGAGSFVGAGAVVVDHTIIPPDSFIKALERRK
jgi:sugar O-acyltransferase (sialic acid O-acetyltransferase NeuD family)